MPTECVQFAFASSSGCIHINEFSAVLSTLIFWTITLIFVYHFGNLIARWLVYLLPQPQTKPLPEDDEAEAYNQYCRRWFDNN